jgi:hypothetical protein
MTKVDVNPGICGLKTQLVITADDMQMVELDIHSECPHITAMQSGLTKLDGYEDCFAKYSESKVYKVAEEHCKHLACPVPTAIIKGMEVACGLALPKDVEIHIEKE